MGRKKKGKEGRKSWVLTIRKRRGERIEGKEGRRNKMKGKMSI